MINSRIQNRQTYTGSRGGVLSVEMALTLPVLFLILLAAFELGRANLMRHGAETAAYECARVAILPGATSAEIRQAADRVMLSVGATNFDLTVTPATILSTTRDVEVSVTVPLDQNMALATFVRGFRFTGRCELSTELAQ